MGHEKEPQKLSQEKNRLNWKKVLAVGSIAVSGLFAAIYDEYDKSGKITSYDPIKKGPTLIDNKLRVLSWNMQNKTSSKIEKIESIIEKHDVDAVALQEVSAKDAKELHENFPTAYVKFSMSDAKTKFLEGGYGNVLMTFQEQKNTSSAKISGNSAPDAASKTASGLVADASKLDVSFTQTKAGTQEDRSALAGTVQIQKEEELVDVRVITGHIGAPQDVMHQKQFDKLKTFVKDNAHEEEAAIFCGDLNLGPDEVIPSYVRIGFYAHETKQTTPSGKTIDYCAYSPGNIFGEGEVRVLGNRTDHYALLGSWKAAP